MKDKEIKDWAAFNLSLITREDKDKLKYFIGQREIKIFRDKFFCIHDRRIEQYARLMMQGVLGRVNAEKRWRIASCLKKTKSIFTRRLIKPSLCTGTKIILDIVKRANTPLRDWSGKRAVVCLTHDVDTLQGYNFINSLTSIEKSYNLKSSFIFLTGGEYKISEEIISLLKTNSFEIGLHGLTHDIALAYRQEKKMESIIDAALSRIKFQGIGFRSPALSVSNKLFKVLSKFNMLYDSSIALYYKDRASCFPYLLPGINLWEVPLCLQDDVFFRDMNLTEERALEIVKEFIEDIKEIGGVCILNFHPILIKSRLRFYENFLSLLKKDKDLWITTPEGLIDLMKKRINDGRPQNDVAA